MNRSQRQLKAAAPSITCNRTITLVNIVAIISLSLCLYSSILFQPALASEVAKPSAIITNRRNSFLQRRSKRNDDYPVVQEDDVVVNPDDQESTSVQLEDNDNRNDTENNNSISGDDNGHSDIGKVDAQLSIQDQESEQVEEQGGITSWFSIFMKQDEALPNDGKEETKSVTGNYESDDTVETEKEETNQKDDGLNDGGINVNREGEQSAKESDDSSSMIGNSLLALENKETINQNVLEETDLQDKDESSSDANINGDDNAKKSDDEDNAEKAGREETMIESNGNSASSQNEKPSRNLFAFFRKKNVSKNVPKNEKVIETIDQPMNETSSEVITDSSELDNSMEVDDSTDLGNSTDLGDSTESVDSTDSSDSVIPTQSITKDSPVRRTHEAPMLPMLPPSSMIFFPPPPSRPSSRSGGMSSSPMPMSPTEATLTSIISSILPLVVRLLVITLLSSSPLFGHGGMHVYSPEPSQHFVFERVNDRYFKDNIAMKKALEHPPENRSNHAWKYTLIKRRNGLRKIFLSERNSNNKDDSSKTKLSNQQIYSRTVILMNIETMETNMDVTVENLRDSISCILRQYQGKARLDMGNELEVVFCIESPGGVVQDFGLASDQLAQLREVGKEHGDLIVTVCVDKIAASGGYMMACQASPGQLLAAPFAILGSIGVLRETINVHDVLEKYGVRPLLMKAGDAKVPLTPTTKVTEESLELVQKNLDRIHDAFRDMVAKARGEVLNEATYEEATNGDVFLGKHAVEYGLVDRIMTSDEYISERVQAGDRVLRMHKYDKSRMGMRFSPLDILLLKSNGILGKTFVRRMLHSAARASPFVFKCSTAFGIMKAIDKNFSNINLRQI